MQRRIYNGISVDYYSLTEPVPLDTSTAYSIACARPEDTERIRELEKAGFNFHNRTFLCEIPLQKLNTDFIKMLRADVRKDAAFTEDIYALAARAFVTDRRFHLKKDFDQDFAGRVMRGYIDSLKDSGCFRFQCFHKDLLTGFTLVKSYNDMACENMLGAVDPIYQNRGVAFQLYVYMANALREMGYKSLYGRISTSNTSSINLHIMLGGKFSAVEDEYIFRK